MLNFSRSSLTDFYYQIPSSPVMIGLILAVVGSLSGIIMAFGGPLVGLGLIVAIVSGLIVLSNMEVGIWGVIAVVTLLPFATLPFKIVITPTFLDLALGGVFAVWVLRLVTGRQRRIVAGPVAFPLIIFVLIMLFAFVFGMPNGPLTSQLLRKFAELLLSLIFVILLIDFCRTWADLQRLTFAVMLAGTAAAIIGIVVWALPDEFANELLNMLTIIGYPGGFVIRYVEDNPEALERAIGTSVDPNVYGGLLVLMGTLVAPQLVAEKPLFWGRRWISWAAFLCIFVALLLTNSRGAFIGLVASVGFLAFVRYRQLLPWGTAALGVILLFILPTTQDAITSVVRFTAGESTADIATAYTERLTDAFEGEDLATQMRIGEYRDGVRLIQRYPLFGVGFAGSPDIDLYLGVASVYLTIAQQMGLLGLFSFFVLVGSVFFQAWRKREIFLANPERDPVWLGLHGAVFGGLVVGLFDHYLFNLVFLHAVTMFWMILGLAVASTRLAEAEE